ncbi:MAG: hypothetical protein QG622_1819 [Actinomycetota bacterium]|nr:hypothetical protein [Actinomycetota bacterium]
MVDEVADVPPGEPGGYGEPLAPPVTGDPIVDEAIASLAEVVARPLDAQPAGFESVHRVLTDRLVDVEG